MFGDDLVLFLIVLTLILCLGVVIYIQNRKNALHKSFLYLSIAIAIWVFANYMEDAVSLYSLKAVLTQIDFISALYMAYFFFDFCYVFSKDQVQIPRISIYRKILFSISILFSLLILFSQAVIGHVLLSNGVSNPVYGNLHFPYIAYLVLVDLMGLWFLLIKYAKEDSSTKKQTVSVFLGSFLVVIAMVIANIVLPMIMGYSSNFLFLSRLGVYSVLILIGFMSYSIAKSNFLNIKIITAQLFSIAMVLVFFYEILSSQSKQELFLRIILFLLVLYFASMIVTYVKLEVKRKEEVEMLNKEINERKEELQKMSDSLAVANDQMKKLDRAKSEFISRASHDLRTPLTGIKGYVSMLAEGSYGEVTDKQKDILGKTYSIGEGMLSLVEDLLSASKLEAQGMSYEFGKWKIEDVCQQIVDTLYPKAKGMGLYLDYQKPQEVLPELVIDGRRIKEAISNLVDNAVKYSKQGGVTVRLERAEASNYQPPVTSNPNEKFTMITGAVARITISDTGIGIPKDEIPYLFAKFSRGKDTTRLNAGGTGLGLYICKGFIEGNGGKIWVESEGDGKGSRFIVELPIETPKDILEQSVDKN